MELLGKLVEPVALFALALAVLAALAFRRRERALFALAAATGAAWLALSTPVGANLWLGLLEDRAMASRDCPPPPAGAVVIVLAGGIAGDPEASDTARLSGATIKRVMAAATVARRHAGTTFVLSGGSGGSVREAELMRTLMTDLGVEADRLLVERDSRNTRENGEFTARLIARNGWQARPAYLLTSALHLPRAIATFRGAGIEACPIAADRRRERLDATTAWIPTAGALANSLLAAHEFIGLAAYAVMGRL